MKWNRKWRTKWKLGLSGDYILNFTRIRGPIVGFLLHYGSPIYTSPFVGNSYPGQVPHGENYGDSPSFCNPKLTLHPKPETTLINPRP